MPRQHLTPNACLVCRKKRTKCDGETPCRRCRSRGEECSYEDKKWRTKDHLRSEIERLRNEQQKGQALIQALVDNNPELCEAILDRLRADESPDAIAAWIRSVNCLTGTSPPVPDFFMGNTGASNPGPHSQSPIRGPALSGMAPLSSLSLQSLGLDSFETYSPAIKSSFCGGFAPAAQSPMTGTSRACFSTTEMPAESHPSLSKNGTGFSASQEFPIGIPSLSGATLSMRGSICTDLPGITNEPLLRTWTNVTSDTELVQKLVSRFFSSSFPSMSLISQPHFINGFREGNTRYCSEALVNAILGTTCRLYNATSQLISRVSFGDAFVGEAKRLLAAEHSHVTLPSIQALGILALAEVSFGNDEEAENLVRESVRASVHLVLGSQQHDAEDSEGFRVAKALAYCGVFSLMRFVRLLTGDLEPKSGPLFIRLHPDPSDTSEDTPETRVERGIALQTRFFAELKYCSPLSRFVFELTEATHTFLSYNYSRAMTSTDLEGVYDRCTGYYKQFVKSTFSADVDDNPDLLFAQIWYHFCMLSLLRPFITSSASLADDLPPRLSDDATPQRVCQQASEAIISLTSMYQARHSLAFLPPLLPYMVFTAVLYQVTLVPNRTDSAADPQEDLNESPTGLSPRSAFESSAHKTAKSNSLHLRMSQVSHAPAFSTTRSEPVSPTLTMPVKRVTQRRASGFSTISTAYSSSDQGRRASACSLISDTAVDRDEPSSASDTGSAVSDWLPAFSSQPVDFVTIGSLQLASMGAQHTGAAEATRFLRSLSNIHGQTTFKTALASLGGPLPFFGGRAFGTSMLMTGLGMQKDMEPELNSGGVPFGRIQSPVHASVTPDPGLSTSSADLLSCMSPSGKSMPSRASAYSN
ncbi:putative conidial development protein fluffy [Podospora australis]|uniref:Conidial development protein fluffy n=1 Tax=Podospora australis TaxID=1536484 RepID=A0AAN6WP20_9PEZI|nr:putative conidial development protein fluffy [Podospora australis]